MLIIAIPKSASTALIKTIGKLHGLATEQTFFGDSPIPRSYRILWYFHSDMRELSVQQAKSFSDKRCFFKQHVPPTKNNISLLSNAQKVILLRSPEDVIAAYWRGTKTGVHDRLEGFEGLQTLGQWMSKAIDTGLLSDLEHFYTTWKNQESETTLIIMYEELMNDPTWVVRRIESFFNLPDTEGRIELVKARYSRISARSIFINHVFLKPGRLALSFIKSLIKKI